MSGDKPWDRPWSMDEIIEHSNNWNLAGDVALLNTLKTFADNLLTKTNEINNNLENLTKDLNDTSLQLNIAQNQFQGLRNTQFIESRVYEDDESLPQKESENPKQKTEEEKNNDVTEDIRLAAMKGLEILDKYFEKVEVEVSDSEDEDIDLPSYVLRPKDPYIDRPLPYVIGTDEWHKSLHVGLEVSSSDSETEHVSDKFSESESESDLPVLRDRSQIKGTSDTSSELDFSQRTDANNKVINNDQKEFFNSSDSENSISVQNSSNGRNFAEELAAKLGNVVGGQVQEPEINRRPIQPIKPDYGDIFFDEPPPLDEPKGLFSGSNNLFDDDDDDKYESSKITRGGLFESGDSEDDLFVEKSVQNTKRTIFVDEPRRGALLLDEPPEDVGEEKRKKPVGGVPIIGGKSLFDKKLLRRQPSSEEEEEKEETKVDLFADDGLFKTSTKEKNSNVRNGNTVKKVNLFDSDEEEDSKPEDIFSRPKEEKTKVKKMNLFDSDDDKDEENSSLFLPKEKPKTEKKINLFDDVDEERTKSDSGKVSLFGKDQNGKEEKQTDEKKIRLFDDDDDLFKDDLFSSNSKTKFTSSLFDDIPEDDLFATNSEEKSKASPGLFDNLIGADDLNSKNIHSEIEIKKEESGNFFEQRTEKRNIFSSTPEEKISIKQEPQSTEEVDKLGTEDTSLKKEEIGVFFRRDDVTPQPKPKKEIVTPPSEENLFFGPSEPNEQSFDNLFASSGDKNEILESEKEDIFSSTEQEKVGLLSDKSKPKIRNEVKKLDKESLFDSSTEKDNIFGSSQLQPETKPRLSLFDSPPPSPDNLFFSSIPETSPEERPSPKIPTSQVTPTPIPSLRLFDPNPPPDDADWDTKSNNLSENEEFDNNLDDNSQSSEKSCLFSEEPPSLDIDKPESIKPKPGKLKHNLKINVGALMPGAAPPKRNSAHSNPPIDDVPDDVFSTSQNSDIKTSSNDMPGSLFDGSDGVEVLHSVTKDRGKGPLNRRPSTRRGRKAAMKTTNSDFKLEKDDNQDGEPSKNDSLFDNVSKDATPQSDPFEQESKDVFGAASSETNVKKFDSSEQDDDLFGFQSKILTAIATSKPKPPIFVEEDEDLFSGKSQTASKPDDKSPKTVTKPSKVQNLFDDDDDGDDLFSSKKLPSQATSVKKSLFDDENDDIFKSSSSASARKPETKMATERKVTRVSNIKKLENTQPDEDPLSALLK